MRILVTGSDGFVGRHLCAHLRGRGDEVAEARGPVPHPDGDPLRIDVTDAARVRATVKAAAPEGVIHLAGFASVGKSHQDPSLAFRVNALGAVNLLTAVRDEVPAARVVLVGSGESYGAISPGTRATEELPLVPASPYAAGKVAAEIAAAQFQRSYGLHVVCARPFNHLGRGQDPGFVVPSMAAQIQAIRRGEAPAVLQVGNLEPWRDFSHVEDVVAAYRLLLEKGEAGAAYNICSGEGRTIRSVIDELVALAGVELRIEVDASRVRAVEIPYLVGDPAKLERLGWRRSHSVREALTQVLEEHARRS